MRIHAKIKKVGGFRETEYGLEPVGWMFDGEGRGVVMIEIYDDECFWAGWSVKELQEVASRPSEFV